MAIKSKGIANLEETVICSPIVVNLYRTRRADSGL